jgi:uncharacterized lipoprotein
MRKKFLLKIGASLLAVMIVTACSSEEKQQEEPTQDQPSEEGNTEEDTKEGTQ